MNPPILLKMMAQLNRSGLMVSIGCAWPWLINSTNSLIRCRLKSSSRKDFTLGYPDITPLNDFVSAEMPEEKITDLLKIAGVALILIALARPQSISSSKEPPKPVVDIVICLDTSLSMSAVDFDPDNRLDAAKSAAEEFIRKRPLDRLGLVVFGGKAITQCPLTLDHETLIELLKSVPINATQTDGTAIGSALALSSTLLADSEAKSKVVILLTDGRNNTGNIDPVTATRAAKDLGIKIYSIGCAVPGGGLIPVEDPVFGKRLVKMAEDLDEPALMEIARVSGAKYFRVTSMKRFKEIYNEIDSMEKTKIETETLSQKKDLYVPVLVLVFVFLFTGFALKESVWRTVP